MAVISLDLTSVASWPGTSRWPEAHAETICRGWRPLDLAWVRREVLPSIATMSGSPSRRPLTRETKHSENSLGFRR